MKFAVDGMLGSLARWLRMLGHSVVYDSKADDNRLMDIALLQGMILLTRDEELYKRASARTIPALLVKGVNEEERLAELSTALHLSLEIDLAETKCPECGQELREASKEEVSKTVAATSLQLYDRFWRCKNSNCGKVYWMGSHWRQIKHTLTRARKLAALNP